MILNFACISTTNTCSIQKGIFCPLAAMRNICFQLTLTIYCSIIRLSSISKLYSNQLRFCFLEPALQVLASYFTIWFIFSAAEFYISLSLLDSFLIRPKLTSKLLFLLLAFLHNSIAFRPEIWHNFVIIL